MSSCSCDLTRTFPHQHASVTCCDMASSTSNHHAPTPPQHIAQRRCTPALPQHHPHATSHKLDHRKPPRLPKKDDNRPTNAHDHLTTTTTQHNQHNHPQTTTSAHKKDQRPRPADPEPRAIIERVTWQRRRLSSFVLYMTHAVSTPTTSIITHPTDATPPPVDSPLAAVS